MDVSGWLHVPITLSPAKSPWHPIEYEAELYSQYGRCKKKGKICPTVTKLHGCFENGTSMLGNTYAKMLHFCNNNPVLHLENSV
jgi:hypothetical protein